MNKKTSRFTADFLIADAKIRLDFERARKKQSTMNGYDNVIQFLPLAAAGKDWITESYYFSQDHNFSVTFSQDDTHCICELQAQGYSSIKRVQGKSIPLCFEQSFFYLATFDESGFARVLLPVQSGDEQAWQTLAFTLKI